ncbi:uncharacterized protein LOC122881201 isoform X1 [Xyrichtys novacula]|uniref:Uncharacterized protein LOC122881201 isoform X1 n=1 Tax=Xyrichtys novacula TaxID=13765 RepID=A0AAV1FP58_XYRNO|nr:uncharacterized protein LOC122881201 isoform X1 [Xyrichtys novacula]
MNLARNKSFDPHLRDDEAAVVENAIRLAIDSIINVLYGVNGARTREQQRMVADRDKEIQRLERRLGEMEHELQALRRKGCACRLPKEPSLVIGSQSSGEPQQGEQSGSEPSCLDSEMTEQQECEVTISLDLFARPLSQVSSQSQESGLPYSPSRLGLDQTCTSHYSESSGVSDADRNPLTSPNRSVVIKEEPCEDTAVMIKMEMSEERITEGPESTSGFYQDTESPSLTKNLNNRGRRRTRERTHADSDRLSVTMGGNPRSKKRNIPMAELPEEAQILKRAAWRAASRRYYARKVARQQRKKALISELPVDSQSLQREAWRASSKRYYARKMARLQPAPSQYLLQGMDPSEETLGPDRGGSHTNSGGIMCS